MMGERMRLDILLLGSPRIELDGAPIQVDTRKAIGLLAYLAVTGQGHHRDTLATLLWPEYDQVSARGSLRRTLSALKKGLGTDSDWLDIERERLALRQDPDVWIDVQHFKSALNELERHGHAARSAASVCAACVEPLSRATELYRGDFLAGFTLRESASFDDWQLYQADLFRRQLSAALERLVDALSALRQYQQAIPHARRWLSLDTLHESAYRRLMLLYAWAGDRSAALRQYRECARTLEKELGVSPLSETTQLMEAIKEDRAPAPPQVLEPETPSPPAQPPIQVEARRRPHPEPTRLALVGRPHELAILLGAYEQANTRGQMVIVEGEAGIGKTRLAEELLQHARGLGAGVLTARCYEGEVALAYGPFTSLLRSAATSQSAAVHQVPGHWLAEAGRLVPELGRLQPNLPSAIPGDDPGAQGRFLEGLSQVLLGALDGHRPAGSPPVVFIDDLHWADEASLDLLTYLARRLGDRRLLLLGAWRTERVPRMHRLRRLLAEATRDGRGEALVLGRLNQAEVAQLVHMLNPDVAASRPTLGAELFRESEGVPFFVVEYLRAVSAGAITPGLDAKHVPLPGGVRELLQASLAELSDTAGQVLAAAATIGRSFEFDVMREASGRSEEEAVAALEALVVRGIVQEVPGAALPTFDFTHERLREVANDETSLLRRRLLHRRVAEVLSRRASGPRGDSGVCAAVAAHYQAGGQDAEAAHYFRLAGEHARRLFANTEALAHFRAALALGHPETSPLHEAMGDLLVLAGDYAAAQPCYELAAAEADPGHVPTIEHKLGELYGRRGEWELADSQFQAALSALGDDAETAMRARINADWSLTLRRRGQRQRANELALEALGLAESGGDARSLAQTHNIVGILATDDRDFARAQEHLGRSLNLAEELGDRSARVAALNNLALAYGSEANVDRAFELFQEALTLCVALGDRHREAALHNNLADLLQAVGRSEEAMTHLKQAVALFAEVGGEPGAMPPPEVWKLAVW